MMEISYKELQISKEIVEKGLVKAAESLSFFMKEEIQLDGMNSSITGNTDSENYSTKQGDNIYLLITEVIGEMKGICCLIFSSQEALKLMERALPPEILNNKEAMQEMGDGIMLEVDNIISASVITQFSNILKVKIFGGVPALMKVNGQGVNSFISNKLKDNMYGISFNAHFISNGLDFNPQFLWMFDNTFSEKIRSYISANQENITI